MEIGLKQTRHIGADAAPKIAEEVKNTARRAVYYLNKEAPPASVRVGLLGVHNTEPRYSDQQVSEWESKRKAALGAANGTTAPEALIGDMKKGRLNREAIKTIEFVSPKLFAQIQDMAQQELFRLEQQGKLDSMPQQHKAAIASLLKVAPDGTWTPDFMAMLKQAKAATAAPAPPPAPGGPAPLAKRPIEINPAIFATESAAIEAGTLQGSM